MGVAGASSYGFLGCFHLEKLDLTRVDRGTLGKGKRLKGTRNRMECQELTHRKSSEYIVRDYIDARITNEQMLR